MPKRDSAPVGAPCWVDLFTSDPEQSLAFYVELFGWAVDGPHEEFGGKLVSTGMLPEAVPAHWAVYFGVADADAALARIGELGGSMVMPAEDTPFGRIAQAADPTGAQFKLVAGS